MTNRSFFNIIIFVSIAVLLYSCSPKIAFTTGLKNKYKLSNDDLARVQYYLSTELILRKEITTKDSKGIGKGHTLVTEKGKLKDQVIFGSKIPGIVVGASDSALKVSFEQGKYLTFYLPDNHSDTLKKFVLKKDPKGVLYDTSYYQYTSDNPDVYLKVIERKLSSNKFNNRYAKGIKLQD
jgi:hypothetical protein